MEREQSTTSRLNKVFSSKFPAGYPYQRIPKKPKIYNDRNVGIITKYEGIFLTMYIMINSSSHISDRNYQHYI